MARWGLAGRSGGLLLVAAAILWAACGGASTAGTKGGLQLTPVGDDTEAAILAANEKWGEWKEAGGKFLDRDFFDCYELNGVPRPVSTSVPDPSGHSRARRGCDEALAAIEKALPDYQRFAEAATAIRAEPDSPFKRQLDALVTARNERLKWAQASVAAWKKSDTEALQTLRKQVTELAQLEAAALGVSFTDISPVPRPTLDHIPGVATSTPPARP